MGSNEIENRATVVIGLNGISYMHHNLVINRFPHITRLLEHTKTDPPNGKTVLAILRKQAFIRVTFFLAKR
jgi:hypothetical protein